MLKCWWCCKYQLANEINAWCCSLTSPCMALRQWDAPPARQRARSSTPKTGAGFTAASSALTPEWWILSRLTTRMLILTKSRNDGAAGHVNFLVNKSAKLCDACEQCGPPQMEASHLLLSFQPLWIYFFLMQSCQWWYIWTRNLLWLKDNVYVTGRRVQLIITGKEKERKKKISRMVGSIALQARWKRNDCSS